MDDLKNHIFFYIKNLDDASPGASRFYLLVQDNLEDITQSLSFVSKSSYKHVKNGHRGLRFNQIRGLERVNQELQDLMQDVRSTFENENLDELPQLIAKRDRYLDFIAAEIEKQIERTKEPDSSSRNSSLYFSILLECKDIVEAIMKLLQQYYREYELAKKPDIL
jgi:Na+/phosphate symporter